MSDDEKRALIDRYIDAYNAFDVVGMIATVDPAVEFENISGGSVTARASGVEALRELAEHSKTLFLSRRQTVVSIHPDGERTVVEIAFEGTLAADLPNGMKAGQTLALNGRSEFEFANGRISRISDYS